MGRDGAGCWLLENRPRILKRELPSGPRHPVQRLVPAGRAHLSRTYHNIHEYYCSNNGNDPEIYKNFKITICLPWRILALLSCIVTCKTVIIFCLAPYNGLGLPLSTKRAGHEAA